MTATDRILLTIAVLAERHDELADKPVRQARVAVELRAQRLALLRERHSVAQRKKARR